MSIMMRGAEASCIQPTLVTLQFSSFWTITEAIRCVCSHWANMCRKPINFLWDRIHQLVY